MRRLWGVTVVMAVAATGCGGSRKPATGLKGAAPPPPATAPAKTEPQADPAAETKTAAKSSPSRSTSTGEDEGEASQNRFLAGGPDASGSRYVIDGSGRSADTFVATISAEKTNSRQFIAGIAPPPASITSDPEATVRETKVGFVGTNDGSSGSGKLPKGFAAIPGSGIGPGNWPWRIRGETDNAEMVLIPAGPSLVGMDDGPENASPAVGVFLDAFYIDVHEVTAAQYDLFREAQKVRRIVPASRTAKDPLEPVLGVNWGEANAYVKWAEKDLPTEAQWEKAARGSEGFRSPWGNGVHLWHRPRTATQIDPVGSFPTDVSPFGVMDMAGNAREWCQDWYAADIFEQLKSGKESTPRNPKGAKHGGGQSLRVVKGGGSEWLATFRTGVPMTDRLPEIGFRCVLNLKADLPTTKPADFGTKTGPGSKKPAPKEE